MPSQFPKSRETAWTWQHVTAPLWDDQVDKFSSSRCSFSPGKSCKCLNPVDYLFNLVLKDISEREISSFSWIIGKCYIKIWKTHAAHYNLAFLLKCQNISEAKSSAEFWNQLDNYSDPWVVIVKTKQRLISSSSINKQTHALEGIINFLPSGHKQLLTNGIWEEILRKIYCT